eukprot:scaffold138082_cov118-Phaeocystis_antarctica.AAC.1
MTSHAPPSPTRYTETCTMRGPSGCVHTMVVPDAVSVAAMSVAAVTVWLLLVVNWKKGSLISSSFESVSMRTLRNATRKQSITYISMSVAYEMLGSFPEITYLKATIARRQVSVMEQRLESSSGLSAYATNIEVVTMKRGSMTLKTQ